MIKFEILTRRNIGRRHNTDIVYEWEDVFADLCKSDFVSERRWGDRLMRLGIPLHWLYGKGLKFSFQMMPDLHRRYSSKYVIPLIIDFYIKDFQGLQSFYKAYSKCPIILISSKEVYDFLQAEKCPLPIYHLPLSLSDKFTIHEDVNFRKKYDVVWFGRYNPVLYGFLQQYAKKHPQLYYVYRKQRGYYTNRGEVLGELSTRTEYMNLLRSARVGLYHTPGMDGGSDRTKGFNQVTPRFLEMIASGCHVLARYENNADTEFYELPLFSPNIKSYDQFSNLLDHYLKTRVDMRFYSEYMLKHYTSTVVKQFVGILKNIEK